jgi:hypothetical protein
MSRGKAADPRALCKAKREKKARTIAAAEQRHLRSELLGIVGDVGSLVPREVSLPLAAASTTVVEFVRGIAQALEGMEGTEHRGSVEVLGALSDLARMRMLPSEQALPLDTPSDILRWFATYLERTLDKPSLRMG